ncbi:MAG: class I SAM-dependent methyltransferase [Anaerolineales bacterium]
MGRHVDYDSLAPTYNGRYMASPRPRTAASLRALLERAQAERVLEVGCGTGHWLQALSPEKHTRWGLDLSHGMLQQARAGSFDLPLVQARAGRLPFGDANFDAIYCVNALHHFDEQRGFILEARRRLRPGGLLAFIGTDPHGRRESWYVYDYFAGTYETDLQRFPSWGTVTDWMLEAGFERLELLPVERIEESWAGRKVYGSTFLQKDACSQLALLSDAAYVAGLERMEEAIREAERRREFLYFRSDILLQLLVGWVPADPS